MTVAVAHHAAVEPKPGPLEGNLGRIAAVIIALGGIGSALLYTSDRIFKVRKTVDDSPRHARALRNLDRRMTIMEWYLPAIGKKLGVPPPPVLPPGRRERDED